MPRGYHADGTRTGLQPMARQPEHKRTSQMPDERLCRFCETVKPWHQFGIDAKGKDGLSIRCLECGRAYQAEWRAKKEALHASFETPKEQTVRKAKERTMRDMTTRPDIVIEPEQPPEPTPLAGLFQMLSQTTTTTVEREDDTPLRFQLAAQMLANQQEILKLLLSKE